MTYHHVDFDGFTPKHAVGVYSELMWNKWVGVELSLGGGKNYFNYGVGSVLLPPMLYLISKINESNKAGVGMIILFLAVPSFLEQTNFHVALAPKIEIVAYISLLKLKYLYDKDYTYHNLHLMHFISQSLGLKLSFKTKKNWCISSNFEINRLIRGSDIQGQLNQHINIPGFQLGIAIGHDLL